MSHFDTHTAPFHLVFNDGSSENHQHLIVFSVVFGIKVMTRDSLLQTDRTILESDRQSSHFGKVTDHLPVILGMSPPLELEGLGVRDVTVEQL